eukprot:XP_001701657.1 predicted protein [Chlamydomonas reinhardtii]
MADPDAEVLFLIWRSLASGPLKNVAKALEEEAAKHGLLPTRVDIAGEVRPVEFEVHARVQSHVGPESLRRLLDKFVQQNAEALPGPGVKVVSLTAPGKHGLLGQPEPPLPAWWRRPYCQASLPHQLLLRQTGVALTHLATLRGHRVAAYCCMYDNTGRRLCTGSDDCLVKIWSAETGMLLRSCRGHDAEITDLAVSADNRLLASGDTAHQIRVWSLQEETLGWPVAVLQGHTGPISFLDFHPHLPDALLSCSVDGSQAQSAGPDMLITGSREASRVRSPPPGAGGAGPSAAAATGAAAGAGQASGATDAATGAAAGAASGSEAELPPLTLTFICCCWSPDGRYILAGGSNPAVCVWHWDLSAPPAAAGAGAGAGAAAAGAAKAEAQQQAQAQAQGMEQQQGGPQGNGPSPHLTQAPQAAELKAAAPAGPEGAGLPAHAAAAPQPLAPPPPQQQRSHEQAGQAAGEAGAEARAGANPVPIKQEAPHGTPQAAAANGVATGGADISLCFGSAAVQAAAADSVVAAWEGREWPLPRIWQFDPAVGGPREPWRPVQVLACPPTEEEVRKARIKRRAPTHPAINQVVWTKDDSRVVAALSDSTVRVWEVHTSQSHVLEPHPADPRLVLSGGYDGRLVLWDVVLVDGHWSPGGGQLAATDSAGQLHVWGLPVCAAAGSLARAPYDQFLGSDYGALVRDVHGWVLDSLSQQPPHLMTGGGAATLCDYTNHPHDIDVQAAWAARSWSRLPPRPPVDRDHPLPPSLISHPPARATGAIRGMYLIPEDPNAPAPPARPLSRYAFVDGSSSDSSSSSSDHDDARDAAVTLSDVEAGAGASDEDDDVQLASSHGPEFYCPQLGDEVVYLRDAHLDLKLQVLAEGGGDAAGQVPRFLVPLPQYCRAVQRPWALGEQVQGDRNTG